MKSRMAIAVFVIIFLSIPLDMAAQARFITFDVPGSFGIFPASINPAGEIAGFYFDLNFASHGFFREPHGTIIKFDVPNSNSTSLVSINPAGAITGNYTQANRLGAHGFLREPNGTIITFDVPDAVSTSPTSINPAGVITGNFLAANDPTFLSHGFVRQPNGTISKFDAPGAGTSGPGGTDPLSINPEGVITGNFFDNASVSHGFVREPNGSITTFDNPEPGTPPFQTSPDLTPHSINPAGAITGNYLNASTAVSHGFLRRPGGGIITFEAPDAGTSPFFDGTFPLSINPEGVITGNYIDNSTVSHGFVRKPDGSITAFEAPDAGTRPNEGTFPSSINPAGTITGFYVDKNGLGHGFLRIRCERDDDRECEHHEDGQTNCSCDPNVR